MYEPSHKELTLRAEQWLKTIGCNVVFRDDFRPYTSNGEQPDAIGWKGNICIVIECKTSMSDFYSDKRKSFRKIPEKGMGVYRFYMCPDNLIKVHNIPDGWGLLYAKPKIIKRVFNVPKKFIEHLAPFYKKNCSKSESDMLLSAVRRMQIRGAFDLIYESIDSKEVFVPNLT